jgi:hypothetical protein
MPTNNTADLVLEPLPNGEHAWLRPDDDEPRYWITDQGRRALAAATARCPACSQTHDTPSCATREHWGC